MNNFNNNNEDVFINHSAWGDFSLDEGIIIEFCNYSNGVITCHIN